MLLIFIHYLKNYFFLSYYLMNFPQEHGYLLLLWIKKKNTSKLWPNPLKHSGLLLWLLIKFSQDSWHKHNMKAMHLKIKKFMELFVAFLTLYHTTIQCDRISDPFEYKDLELFWFTSLQSCITVGHRLTVKSATHLGTGTEASTGGQLSPSYPCWATSLYVIIVPLSQRIAFSSKIKVHWNYYYCTAH